MRAIQRIRWRLYRKLRINIVIRIVKTILGILPNYGKFCVYVINDDKSFVLRRFLYYYFKIYSGDILSCTKKILSMDYSSHYYIRPDDFAKKKRSYRITETKRLIRILFNYG